MNAAAPLTDDLRTLYQEIILDHGRNPRHFGVLPGHNREARGHNPLCGDRIHLYLMMNGNDRVEDIAFEGKGCAISVASASMMTELVKGRTEAQARKLMDVFLHLAKGEHVDADGLGEDDLESLNAMNGVSQFPMRVKCATLAWHTLDEAMRGGAEKGGDGGEVTTDDE